MDPTLEKSVVLKFQDHMQTPGKDFLDIMGYEGLCAFADTYGGSTIYVPLKRSIIRPCVFQAVREEYNGVNAVELVRKYAVPMSTIRKIVA
jgi:Mor family transcriptional regulator